MGEQGEKVEKGQKGEMWKGIYKKKKRFLNCLGRGRTKKRFQKVKKVWKG